MKHIIRLMVLIVIFLILFTGCGTIDGGRSNEDSFTFEAEVIDAGTALMITPGKDSNEYKSSDKMSVGLIDVAIIGIDGEEITLEELKAGDLIEITYNGIILESYPAQISASAVKVTGHNLLIDGYLALIDDIYQEDDALNSDISMIALDTTGWTGLTDIEKEIIFTEIKEIYGFEIIEGTFDELSEHGIIDKDNLYFPDGILITLGNVNYDEKDKKITCATQKWRSGIGAIGSDNVTAEYKDGNWEIKKSGMWIS